MRPVQPRVLPIMYFYVHAAPIPFPCPPSEVSFISHLLFIILFLCSFYHTHISYIYISHMSDIYVVWDCEQDQFSYFFFVENEFLLIHFSYSFFHTKFSHINGFLWTIYSVSLLKFCLVFFFPLVKLHTCTHKHTDYNY